MWDGAINHLDMQALAPISHPAEMGESLEHVIRKIRFSEIYPPLFHKAFQDSLATGANLLKALSQFQLTLISANSKYDQVKKGIQTFSQQEQKGYVLFQQNCNSCHTEPLFTTPLIGFAYDGFPIYGAYGYKNADGTGGIVRIKSGYQLRAITERTTHADGTIVDNGAPINDVYFLGYFREDYEHIASADEDVLDVHNGRICVTPEYPDGTYAYFATVDENWNSAYPYVMGPTFYGVSANRKVNSVDEATTIYDGMTSISESEFEQLNISVFPNPASDLIAIQLNGLVEDDFQIELLDISGNLIESTLIKKGSTVAYFDVQTLYEGIYLVKISSNNHTTARKVIISKE